MLEFQNTDISVSGTPILKDISVQFQKGKITSIIGPNGCGKTTLLQTLNGISTVTAGRILMDQEVYLNYSPRERARHLSFMPQFRESIPCITVKGLVEHGRFPYMGFSRKMSKHDLAAVERALEYADITQYRDCKVNELSGGLQQRAFLAMQLAQDSPYMVLDEPLNYLDFSGKRELCNVIRRLCREGKTIIMVVHDLCRALQLSDQIVVMDARKIVGTGSPDTILSEHLIEKVFHCQLDVVDFQGEKQFLIR